MRFTVKYVGGVGTIDMSKPPILYQTHDFINYSVNYDDTDLPSGRGSRITRFKKKGSSFSITLSVWGESMFQELNRITAIVDADRASMTPGRLEVNGEYMKVYLISQEKSDWEKAGNGLSLKLTFFSEYPSWITESEYNFSIFGGGELEGGISFPFSFPFSFKDLQGSRKIINNHYDSAAAVITMYGPCINPMIKIGEHPYSVTGELLAGERLVIDPRDKTVNKITISGDIIDRFNYRDKVHSVFEPIPIGENVVSYSGDFSVKVLLLYERSEPQWN